MKLKNHLILITALTLLSPNISYAGLMVAPHRVDFDESVNSKEIYLINNGDETATYRISLQHLRMDENGIYKEIKDDKNNGQLEEKFADDLILYSPKKVTLEPKASQTVRLLVKTPNNLPDGEYRSHILFKEEAPADFGNNIEEANKKNKKKAISVVLKPLFAVSIPVIVKHGKLNSESSIEELKIVKDANKNQLLSVKIARSGNESVYGDIVVTLTNDKFKTPKEIGAINGVSVFYPYKSRLVSVPIKLPENAKLHGKVEVRFYAKSNDDNQSSNLNKILSRKILEIE